MLKLLASIAMCVMVAGCASTALSDSESTPTGSGNLLAYQSKLSSNSGVVVVKRDSGMLGAACRIGFYIDGQLAGRIDTSEIAQFHVPAGERLVGIGPGGAGLCSNLALREQSVNLEAGKTRRFRISTDASGVALTPTSQ